MTQQQFDKLKKAIKDASVSSETRILDAIEGIRDGAGGQVVDLVEDLRVAARTERVDTQKRVLAAMRHNRFWNTIMLLAGAAIAAAIILL